MAWNRLKQKQLFVWNKRQNKYTVYGYNTQNNSNRTRRLKFNPSGQCSLLKYHDVLKGYKKKNWHEIGLRRSWVWHCSWTLSWRRSLSYRNQSIDLQSKRVKNRKGIELLLKIWRRWALDFDDKFNKTMPPTCKELATLKLAHHKLFLHAFYRVAVILYENITDKVTNLIFQVDPTVKVPPSKTCGRQPLKNLMWFGPLRLATSLQIFDFYKFYLVHSWIHCPEG